MIFLSCYVCSLRKNDLCWQTEPSSPPKFLDSCGCVADQQVYFFLSYKISKKQNRNSMDWPHYDWRFHSVSCTALPPCSGVCRETSCKTIFRLHLAVWQSAMLSL